MKHLTTIASVLLGLAFIAFSVKFFFKLMPAQPEPPAGSALAMFGGAFYPTGYMAFVKSFELIGGLLLLIPCTRNFGLLVLGPIIVNILAFHIFITGGAGLIDPVLITICVVALFLLWSGRRAFAGLAGTCCKHKHSKCCE